MSADTTRPNPAAAFSKSEERVRSQKAAGQKVIGYISNNVPVELIEAAGMVPFEAIGDPRRTTERGDLYMEDFFDGHIRSLFSRALSGDFAFLDLLIIPRSSEGYLQLYYYLLEAKRWEPDLPLPALYLFDLLQTPFWVTGRYVKDQVLALRDKLSSISGKTVSDQDVWGGIHTVNETRQLLDEVNTIRRADPAYLPGSALLEITRADSFMGRDAFNINLRAVIASHSNRVASANTRSRVMIKGSQHDAADFYELVESVGFDIVADDHFTGERSFESPVETHPESAIEALTRKFQFFSASPRSYPQVGQDEIFTRIAVEAKVDAVIFFLEENDDTLGWDYPNQVAILNDLGIPSLYLKYQPYFGPTTEEQQTEVEAFLQSVQSIRDRVLTDAEV